MNQGESINWSGLGSGAALQKLNGSVGDSATKPDQNDQVPNLTFSLPKRLDDSQEVPNSELPNGHNSPQSEDVPRPKGVGGILDNTEELPETVMVNSAKDESDDKGTPDSKGDADKMISDAKDTASTINAEKTSTKPDDSQDMFDTSGDAAKSSNAYMAMMMGMVPPKISFDFQ